MLCSILGRISSFFSSRAQAALAPDAPKKGLKMSDMDFVDPN